MEPCNCNAMQIPHLHNDQGIVPYVKPVEDSKPAVDVSGPAWNRKPVGGLRPIS